MATDRDSLDLRNSMDLDERTARIGRELYAEVRQRARREEAADKRRRSSRTGDVSDGSGPLDWLFGDGDADGDGGSGD